MKKPLDQSQKKIHELAKRLKAEHEAKLRLAAELQNTTRRFEEERKQLVKRSSRELLEKIFPIFDNFYRAASHAPQVDLEKIPNLGEDDFKRLMNYFEGLRLIERQMEQVLSEVGLKRIPTAGNHFDPKLHEAVSHESSVEVPAEFIVAEVESGWMIDDWVVKPAKVRVSKG